MASRVWRMARGIMAMGGIGAWQTYCNVASVLATMTKVVYISGDRM